ncbi:hypothetical protein CDSM653_00722 [Caldanaerobacter subterraneus subsp. pacificus DSM 12653]|uniref:Uncharacterized protein n=1 Tax=Caldanaerobacter subterraneus subsp. pacificus DSM 12653 TaxID=391606 RepID=A0A0F5PNN9_9THEO|nr:hypothetical protein CDSM653_00722 [Caldanaerobacter subterraneus subsp. pacificus DSM 12653]
MIITSYFFDKLNELQNTIRIKDYHQVMKKAIKK